MAIVAGIDEAGLGPTLGPLVVSGVAFRVPDELADRCLWDVLAESCTHKVRRGDRRLAIADSKKLYQARKTLDPLERAALVMLTVAGKHPKTWRGLLDVIAPGATEQLQSYPWYTDEDVALPIGKSVGDVGTLANAVRRDGMAHGVALTGIFCEPLPAGHYNRLVTNTRNKAVVLLGLALRVVDRIMRAAPGQNIHLHVDRLGGRTHYREALMTAMAGCELQILEESDTRSAYRLVRGERRCEIDFVTKGESRHFPIALASVYSKYVRELYMHVFNRYWSGRVAGLKSTAGYFTDARRWLRDVGEAVEVDGAGRDALVRIR